MAVAPQQRAHARFDDRVEVPDEGEGLAAALSRRLDATGQHFEVRATTRALRLDEGAIDAKHQPIHRGWETMQRCGCSRGDGTEAHMPGSERLFKRVVEDGDANRQERLNGASVPRHLLFF